jgi:hypothetical protein
LDLAVPLTDPLAAPLAAPVAAPARTPLDDSSASCALTRRTVESIESWTWRDTPHLPRDHPATTGAARTRSHRGQPKSRPARPAAAFRAYVVPSSPRDSDLASSSATSATSDDSSSSSAFQDVPAFPGTFRIA